MNIFNRFDKIYLINLKKRQDRLEQWFEQNKLVIDKNSEIQIFEAVDGSKIDSSKWEFEKGALGCLESHLAVLKDAKEKNYGSVLIFEDDFTFNADFKEKFKKGLIELDSEWDMLYLYSNHFKEPKPFSDLLVKASANLTTVAYAVNSKCYDFLIMALELKVREVDVIYAHLHFLINAYSFKANICTHVDGFSDIQNEVTNYQKKKSASILKKTWKKIKSLINF